MGSSSWLTLFCVLSWSCTRTSAPKCFAPLVLKLTSDTKTIPLKLMGFLVCFNHLLSSKNRAWWGFCSRFLWWLFCAWNSTMCIHTHSVYFCIRSSNNCVYKFSFRAAQPQCLTFKWEKFGACAKFSPAHSTVFEFKLCREKKEFSLDILFIYIFCLLLRVVMVFFLAESRITKHNRMPKLADC